MQYDRKFKSETSGVCLSCMTDMYFNPVHLIKTEMMTGPNPLPLKNSAAENLVVPCICIKKAERY